MVQFKSSWELLFEKQGQFIETFFLIFPIADSGNTVVLDFCNIPECGERPKRTNSENPPTDYAKCPVESRIDECSTEQFSCQPGECIYRYFYFIFL